MGFAFDSEFDGGEKMDNNAHVKRIALHPEWLWNKPHRDIKRITKDAMLSTCVRLFVLQSRQKISVDLILGVGWGWQRVGPAVEWSDDNDNENSDGYGSK